jgi:hypothetical protein
MKKLKHFPSFFLKPALGLLAIAVAFTACSDDKDAPTPPASALAIVHAAPGSPALDFKINGTKANGTNLTFGTFLSYGAIVSKTYEMGVTKKDSTRVLTKSDLELKNNKAYTVFVTGVPATPSLVLIEDDLSAPATDKAKLRFVNLSPDGGNLNLGVTGQATPLFTNTAFKAATAFSSVDPAAALTLEIKENTKPEVLATLANVKIEKGKIYTIWAKGLKAATDSTKLALKVITNK